jgi:ectoine hydroxylase-related dioxygenase (phytanoyl-CoA dioxygenase family)
MREADVAAERLMREVTEDEVTEFQANGWVKVERLIDPQIAAAILAAVQTTMLEANTGDAIVQGHGKDAEKIHDRAIWRDWHFPGRDNGLEPIRSLVYSPEIGRNAQLMLGREIPINYHADLMAVKMPAGHGSSAPTGFHQDWVNFPFDRAGFLTFWIALDEIKAEQGAMRFYNGSHRAGPLGKMGLIEGPELPDYYPDLAGEYPLSDPIDLAPGDATIHTGLVVHGAPENTTDRPRWTLIASYHPADTCYTGAPHHIFKPDIGLEVGKPIKHELFPAIYP